MSGNNIGNKAKKIHEKLAQHLSGPFLTFLPKQWIAEVIEDIGYRFRLTAFSPLGNVVGIHRPSSGS